MTHTKPTSDPLANASSGGDRRPTATTVMGGPHASILTKAHAVHQNPFTSAAGLNLLIIGAGTVAAGTGAAALHGNMAILPAILCLLFTVFCQLCSQFAHKYIDIVNNYGETYNEGFLDETPGIKAQIRKAATTAMFILAATVGMTILSMTGWWTILVGLLVFGLMYLTNAGPYPLIRTPFAVVPVWLLFGPIGVLGTLLVQADVSPGDVWNWYYISPGLFAGSSMGFLAANVQIAHNYCNFEFDKENCKDTFVGRFGKKAARIFVIVNGLLALAVLAAFVVFIDSRVVWLMLLPGVLCVVGSFTMATLMHIDRPEIESWIMNVSIWTTGVYGLCCLIAGVCVGDTVHLQFH